MTTSLTTIFYFAYRPWKAGYIVLEVNNGSLVGNFKRVPYDVERAAQAIEGSEMPDEYAEMLRTGTG
jgi:hypothetical protein